MDAYAYNAALWCADCARDVRENLDLAGVEDSGDTNDYPQGPFSNGGGEADCPQHCDGCGVFLENPLTEYGVSYIVDALVDGTGNAEVLRQWSEFYEIPGPDDGCYFDRFDICEAWYLALCAYHGGQNSREYRRLCRLTRPGFFKPSPMLTYDRLSDNGKVLYARAARKLSQVR